MQKIFLKYPIVPSEHTFFVLLSPHLSREVSFFCFGIGRERKGLTGVGVRHRHRVTLKKRYGVLLTQQGMFSPPCDRPSRLLTVRRCQAMVTEGARARGGGGQGRRFRIYTLSSSFYCGIISHLCLLYSSGSSLSREVRLLAAHHTYGRVAYYAGMGEQMGRTGPSSLTPERLTRGQECL